MKLIQAIRALLLYIANFFLSFTILTMILLVLPFSKKHWPFKIASWWGTMSALQSKWICGMRYKIIGQENIPKEPVVFLVKHQSAWETITLTGILPPSCFVVKEALLKIPVYGWGIRALRYIPISRDAGMKAFKQVIRDGKQRVACGLSVIIFPEGTRIMPGEHPKFHKSGASLAKAAGCKIVPIALNSGSCWRRNTFIKRAGLIKVVIGEPIETHGRTTDEVNKEVYNWIKEQMQKIQPGTGVKSNLRC